METWKVFQREPHLEVSSHGRVRLIDSKTEKKAKATPKGYLRITVDGKWKVAGVAKGRVRHYKVHRLVADLFVGGRTDEKNQVNHIDAIKSNNLASNLEWCTPKHNIAHARRLGLLSNRKRRRRGKDKKTEPSNC